MSAHSPGPWRTNEYNEVLDVNGVDVAGSCMLREDAALIAAAPEMLAMLRELEWSAHCNCVNAFGGCPGCGVRRGTLIENGIGPVGHYTGCRLGTLLERLK